MGEGIIERTCCFRNVDIQGGGVLDPLDCIFILELFGNNLEVFLGLLKLSSKIILAVMWKPLG